MSKELWKSAFGTVTDKSALSSFWIGGQ